MHICVKAGFSQHLQLWLANHHLQKGMHTLTT